MENDMADGNNLIPAGDGVIPDDMAKLNITYKGEQGDLPDFVQFDSTDGDLKQMATESVQAGSVPGIDADDEADFTDFVVDRFAAKDDVPFNRLSLRPKTPFGHNEEHERCSKCGGEFDVEGWCANYCVNEQ